MFDESREQFRKSYAGGGDAYQRVPGDRRAYIAMVVIIVLGSLLFELLAHYTKWSFVPRVIVSAGAIMLAQYLVNRLFNEKRRDASEKPVPSNSR